MTLTAIILFALLASEHVLSRYLVREETECIKQLKLDQDEIIANMDPWSQPLPTDYKPLNDFLACSWKKLKMLDNNEKIQWSRVKSYLGNEFTSAIMAANVSAYVAVAVSEMMKNIMDTCQKQNISGSSPGQTIVKILNCIELQTRERAVR
ncbi:hypothetical protein ILUMI_07772 [Ignelater luminosus]|uniref:Uncharacterized protein n=1 Tax=Ignelater luminosus TaxID=2038154 RepID=A0A8K0D384_IGNLU|nr:hypothetical protein ILUMI_07772 [Ignelater luminosus]